MKNRKNVLFISYLFGRSYGVGVQRVLYWADNISKISYGLITCDVLACKISSNEKYPEINNIYCVENDNTSILDTIIQDEGFNWKKSIKRFLISEKENMSYHTILISGGPFMHFSLVPFLRKLFDCQVILDFRDPFANNPRFEERGLKKMVKTYFERSFIKEANHVIVVNNVCLKLMALNKTFQDKFHVIENGFDENIIEQVNFQINKVHNGPIKFIYAGKFYDDISPFTFLNVFSAPEYSDVFSFLYVGENSDVLQKVENSHNINVLGKMNYPSTINLIASSDVGVIFTGGKPFESTTKVFDYIGLEKPILIITEGNIKTGNLHNITRDYPKVFWTENKESSIKKVLKIIGEDNLQLTYFDKHQFSRKEGLKKLIEII